MAAVEIRDLVKQYGEVLAVDGLDLELREGEVFGLLGPNGAGKSTTINALLGFRTPTSGSASVFGHDVVEESLAVRKRTGVLSEDLSVFDHLTGREHVQLAIDLKDATDDPDDLLSYTGLDPDARERSAADYSTGMRQRMWLAMALVGDPDLLILDEPTGGLDPAGIREVREIVREQSEAGTTVFFASHRLPEVEAVCDRVGVLDGGSLSTVTSVDDLESDESSYTTVDIVVETAPEKITEEVTAVDGVRSAEVDDGTIRVTCETAQAKPEVIAVVNESTTVLDVISDESSLESVFDSHATTANGEVA